MPPIVMVYPTFHRNNKSCSVNLGASMYISATASTTTWMWSLEGTIGPRMLFKLTMEASPFSRDVFGRVAAATVRTLLETIT